VYVAKLKHRGDHATNDESAAVITLALMLTLHRPGNIVPLPANREYRKRRNGDVVRLDPRVECSIERDIDYGSRPRLALEDSTPNVREDPEFVALELGDVHAGFPVDEVDSVQRRLPETDLLASAVEDEPDIEPILVCINRGL